MELPLRPREDGVRTSIKKIDGRNRVMLILLTPDHGHSMLYSPTVHVSSYQPFTPEHSFDV
jgi:hypothetical protein